MEPWPLLRTKWSRLAHLGLAGLWLRKSFHRTSAMSAMPMGAPGWPDLAFLMASMLRARMALASSRRDGMGTSRFWFRGDVIIGVRMIRKRAIYLSLRDI